jgi:hypothetical protein
MEAVFARHAQSPTALTAHVTPPSVYYARMASTSRRTPAQPVQLQENGERKPRRLAMTVQKIAYSVPQRQLARFAP